MNIFSRILIVAALLSGTVYSALTGCTKSKCGGVTCQNSATCSNNVCVCPTGYSGQSCDKGWSDKFVGTYNCVRSGCVPGIADVGTWQSAITKSATNGGYTIEISNFDRTGMRVAATIDSFGNVRISPATAGSGTGATGKYDNGVITLHYSTYNAGTISYSCNMTLTKL